jgi:hypothetical protein
MVSSRHLLTLPRPALRRALDHAPAAKRCFASPGTATCVAGAVEQGKRGADIPHSVPDGSVFRVYSQPHYADYVPHSMPEQSAFWVYYPTQTHVDRPILRGQRSAPAPPGGKGQPGSGRSSDETQTVGQVNTLRFLPISHQGEPCFDRRSG